MIGGVADTHAGIWYLSSDPRLSATAKAFFDKAAQDRRKIALSTISLAEIIYLVEKNRLPASAFDDLKAALKNSSHVLQEAPFTGAVVEAMQKVAREAVPDMPDRIVSATAVFLGVPLISGDGRIRASNVQTVGSGQIPGLPVRPYSPL
jgi:PIN domain nuclease of toxin-antitoxin system